MVWSFRRLFGFGQDMADDLVFWSFRRLFGFGHDMAENFGSSILWSFWRLFGWVRTWLMVLVVGNFGPTEGCLVGSGHG